MLDVSNLRIFTEPQQGATYDDLLAVAKRAEQLGFGAFFDQVVGATKKGDKVAWPGFGSFSTSKSAARTGRNPQTGAAVKIPATTRLKFTASSTVKTALNPKRKK